MTAKRYFLKPGEMLLQDMPARIVTILGSCVAVTMRAPGDNIAAICHAILPGKRGHGSMRDGSEYVSSAIDWMIEHFRQRGVAPGRLEVKVFGGASMFGQQSAVWVGEHNVRCAFDVLRRHAISPASWNVGGTQGRYIIFDTRSGAVFHRYVGTASEPFSGQSSKGGDLWSM